MLVSKLDTLHYYNHTGFYEIPVNLLKSPKPGRLLREPDRLFIDTLKKEILENVATPLSPIVGLACIAAGDRYDTRHPQSYMYETIGGNNSRIALQELAKQYPDNKAFKTRLVAVYVGLSDSLTLRLASKHNHASGFTHTMTTQDKVKLVN